jgi:hypothetical protein
MSNTAQQHQRAESEKGEEKSRNVFLIYLENNLYTNQGGGAGGARKTDWLSRKHNQRWDDSGVRTKKQTSPPPTTTTTTTGHDLYPMGKQRRRGSFLTP